MADSELALSPRRWLALAAYMAVVLACEVQWLSHAAVARAAEAFYAGGFDPNSIFNIDFLALTYMAVYLVLAIPASRVIDGRGIRVGVGIGAVLVAIGGAAKALGARSFPAQVAGQLVLACAQPFLINAATALAVRWFPLRERGLVAGLASLAQYLGFVLALAVGPLLVASDPSRADYGAGMDTALAAYGILSVLAALAALAFVRENPAYRPARESGAPPMSMRAVFAGRDMKLTFILFLIGLGIMNAVTSMTDSIAASVGAKDSDGLIGVAMIAGGVIGSLLVPALSDKYRKRKPFIVLCAVLAVPGAAGLAFAGRLNPYAYSWDLVASPPAAAAAAVEAGSAGSAGSVPASSELAHPSFRTEVAGDYDYEFELISRKDGSKVEAGRVRVSVAPRGAAPAPVPTAGAGYAIAAGQVLLLDGTAKDDGAIAAVYAAALAAAFVLGFALMSAGPLGFQYAAEVSHPAPEAASQGGLLLAGQVSGIALVAGMSAANKAHVGTWLYAFAAFSVVMLLVALRLGESPMIITEAEKFSEASNSPAGTRSA